MNSRSKGARGEREWRDFLRSIGLSARRGQQRAGGVDAPDVICDDMPGWHPEVKRVEKLNIQTAMEQAQRDCGDKTPYVAHRRNGKGWLVTMRAEDWAALFAKGGNDAV